MKYIFMVGAPGSKWSSVARNIYYSPNIDRSDYTESRTYSHQAGIMHVGSYFDPGMEFEIPTNIEELSKEQVEEIFDAPFTGTGIRIIKSHTLSNHIDFLRATWPDCPVIMVYRNNDSCLGWWVRCGHFNITYPKYDYYLDFNTMIKHIEEQNNNIKKAQSSYNIMNPNNNQALCMALLIQLPPEEFIQDYATDDVQVSVIR